jgi:hypothetical protein
MVDVEGNVGVSTSPGGAPDIDGDGLLTGMIDGPIPGFCPGRFSPTPAA